MITGHVVAMSDGLRGFDVNATLTPRAAKIFHDNKFDFVARYVTGLHKNTFDLSTGEAEDILGGELGLNVVQHVDNEGWLPTGDLGQRLGAIAANAMSKIGIPPGVSTWCDLEGVGLKAKPTDVIAFNKAWFKEVAAASYLAGLYVGWHPGLSALQLYNLPYTHYWGSYNVDVVPLPRGFQMRQHAASSRDLIPGIGYRIDTNTVFADQLGGRPSMLIAN